MSWNLVPPKYVETLQPYIPGKPISEAQREYKLKDVIKLASNENPLGPSPKAIAAAKKALASAHLYPDPGGFAMKKKLSKHLGVSPQEIILGNGSNDIIDIVLRTYCAPGDQALTSQGAFVAFRVCAQIQGVELFETPMTTDMRFDLEKMWDVLKLNSSIKIVYIPNPNNPTGTYVSSDELYSFLDKIKKQTARPILVILDDAYSEYVRAKDLPRALEIYRKYPFVMVLRTFSKVYGLAGLRLGYGVASPDLLHHMEKVRQPFNVNSAALAACEAALDDKAFLKKTLSTNKEGMAYFEKELKKLKIPFWPSQGNFLLVDAREGLGLEGKQAYEEGLKRGVIFRPVANYGLFHALRISVGTASENKRAIHVLKQIQELKKSS